MLSDTGKKLTGQPNRF